MTSVSGVDSALRFSMHSISQDSVEAVKAYKAELGVANHSFNVPAEKMRLLFDFIQVQRNIERPQDAFILHAVPEEQVEALGAFMKQNVILNVMRDSTAFKAIDSFVEALSRPRSFASRCETKLLTWRNSSITDAKIRNALWFGCKVVCTAVAQPVITVVAIIETIAYAALKLASYLIKSKKEGHYTDLLKSSSFTILWAPSIFFYFNPCFIKQAPPTDEHVTRNYLMLSFRRA